MEAQEEVIPAVATTNPNSNPTATATSVATTATTTIKGKRTKRQRVQSPIRFGNNLTANSSSGGGGDGDVETDGDNIVSTKMIKNYSDFSPTSSQEIQESTQEEEDMANCLILLAQGFNSNNITTYNHFKYSPSPKQDYYDNDAGVYNLNSTTTTTATKFNSRKFLETGSPGSGKAGYYVYECKTCNRTFPSFQALGGHRASHKKPKINMEEKRHFTLSSDEEEGHFKDVSSLSLQLSNNNNNHHRATIYSNSNNHHHNKNKIHECSICGAEFTSGQALGGHMRRHRAPVGAAVAAAASNNNNNGAALSLTSRMSIESEQLQQQEQEGKKARNLISLDLDLNLPAPDEEKMAFASKQQKQEEQQQKPKPPLVFSGPALVDCHY